MGFFKKLLKKDPKSKSASSASHVASAPRKPVTPVSYTKEQADKEDDESPLYPCITDWSTVDTAASKERKELAAQLKNAGDYLNTKGQFDRAVSLYHDAIKCDPQDDSLYVASARCQIAKGTLEDAVKDASDGIRANSKSIQCRMVRGQVYESLERYGDAHYDYMVSLVLANKDHDNMLQGTDRVLKKSIQHQIEQFKAHQDDKLTSVSTMNDFFDTLVEEPIPATLLNAEEGTGDFYLKSALEVLSKRLYSSYEQAFDFVTAAIEHETTEMALALMYRSIFYHFSGKSDAAKRDIEQSIELNPTPRAYVFHSEILFRMRQGQAAMDVLLKGSEMFEEKSAEKSAELRLAIGLLGSRSPSYPNYAISYGLAASYDKNFVMAKIQSALCIVYVLEPKEVIANYAPLLKEYPKDPLVFRYYGQMLLELEKWKKAIPECEKAIALDKAKYGSVTNVGPFIDKAAALEQTKNSEAALATIKEALKIDPLYLVAAESLGEFYLRNNNLEGAADAYTTAAKIVNDDITKSEYLDTAQVAKSQARFKKEYPDLQEIYDQFWANVADSADSA